MANIELLLVADCQHKKRRTVNGGRVLHLANVHGVANWNDAGSLYAIA